MSTFKQNWASFTCGDKTALTVISLIFILNIGLTIAKPSVNAALNILLYASILTLIYTGMVLYHQLEKCRTYLHNTEIERELGQDIADAVEEYGSVTITGHPSAYFIEAPANKYLDEEEDFYHD
ncbi:hypothetical protein GWO56_06880 [Corynebacterium macginleyi]|uniref:hypothetical protein n=1 Tax=Corynebacterium macginleyi TaxID=38290 RepID=UPI00190E06DC|nr:hypothetical protein [Corynebacterium macginleyi]MBK4159261.1 hypothetical protein [Corynebacterium macginleyi]